MNVRCCFLFSMIFAIHAARAIHLIRSEWQLERCACTNVMNEVCGSDGSTYPNLCELDCASAFAPDLTLRNLGPCTVDYDYCDCPSMWNPVCASDGLTYSNACDMRCIAETYNEDIYVDFNGVCPLEDETASGTHMSEEEVEDSNEIDQIGLPCSTYSAADRLCNATLCDSEEDNPLCGNDGITYKNYCAFCCTYFKNPDFKIVQKGDCNATATEEPTTTESARAKKKSPKAED